MKNKQRLTEPFVKESLVRQRFTWIEWIYTLR